MGRHVRAVGALVLASIFGACSSGGSGDPSRATTRSVTVSQSIYRYAENGSQMMLAWGCTGPFTCSPTFSIVGAATTTTPSATGWTVAGAPLGTYTLRIDRSDPSWDASRGPLFVTTDAGHVDLSEEDGYAGEVFPTSGTPVTLSPQGLDPWDTADDRIQLFSWDGALWDVFSPATPVAGDTSWSDVYAWWSPLLSSTDRLYVVQQRYVALSAEVGSYQNLAAGSVTGVTLADGQAATVPVTLSPLASDASLEVDWRTSAFEAGMQPLENGQHHATWIAAVPGADPMRNNTLDLADVFVSAPAADRAVGPLPYAAVVAAYARYAYVGYGGVTTRTAPGAAMGRTFVARNETIRPAPASGTPLVATPEVGPPRAVRIAGWAAPVTGTGLTPAIAWTAPAVGAPSRYVVAIDRLTVDQQGGTASVRVATLVSASPSVDVPPGVLVAGGTYVATIEAQAGAFDEATPLLEGVPYGKASFVTETFSP